MTSNPPSILSSVLVFLGVYLLLAIILNVVLWALETYAGFAMNSNAIGMLPLIIGAMQSGQRYGTIVGAKPSSGYSWTASFLFMLISVTIALGLIYGLFVYSGVQPMVMVNEGLADMQRQGITTVIIAAVLGGIFLLLWVGTRFAFSWGASNGIKMAAKIAAKQGR